MTRFKIEVMLERHVKNIERRCRLYGNTVRDIVKRGAMPVVNSKSFPVDRSWCINLIESRPSTWTSASIYNEKSVYMKPSTLMHAAQEAKEFSS